MDREKVINKVKAIVADMQEEVDEWKDYSDSELRGGLTCDCDWWYKTLQTLKNALALLKAQEPRVMTLEDFENNPSVDKYGCLPCWMEYREEPKWDGWAEATVHTCVEYGRRPWTSRPTDEQRQAVKWE